MNFEALPFLHPALPAARKVTKNLFGRGK